MRSDDELRQISVHDFFNRLTRIERLRWLETVDDIRVDEALKVSVSEELHATESEIRAALVRRSEKSSDVAAERRHRESLTVDRSARNIGWAGLALAILALGVGVFALPQVQSHLSKPEIFQSLSNSAASPPAGLKLLSPPPSSTDDRATPPTVSTPTMPVGLPAPNQATQPPPKK